MNKQEILEKLKEILESENILASDEVEEIKLDTKIKDYLFDECYIDSLDYVSFIIKIEDNFNIEIPESKEGEFDIFEDIVNFIQKES